MVPLMQQKLHSRRGASMVIALIYVVVALAIGAMVLTAAYVNLGHIKRNQIDQQDAQAVTSAVRAVRARLGGKTCTVTYVESQKEILHPATPPDENGEGGSPAWIERLPPEFTKTMTDPKLGGVTYNGSDILLPLELVEDLVYRNSPHPGLADPVRPGGYQVTLSMKLQDSTVGGETVTMPEAVGTLRIVDQVQDETTGLERYGLVLELHALREEESRYTSTIAIPASVSTKSSSAGSETVRDITTYYWTHETKIQWQTPTVTKGAVQ